MKRTELVVAVALATGWPPPSVRDMTLAELGETMHQLEDRARTRRMARATAAARPKGRRR